jgi:hypothetical protein
MMELTELTMVEASAVIAKGEISPTELTHAYLARIDQVNPQLNAYVTVTAERALHAADQASKELITKGPRSLLHGIPLGSRTSSTPRHQDRRRRQGVRRPSSNHRRDGHPTPGRCRRRATRQAEHP